MRRDTLQRCSRRAVSSIARCAAAPSYRVPADDNRDARCTVCGNVHYENPLNVVGTVPVWDDRSAVPAQHRAALRVVELPAGFMELGETRPKARCARTVEEAGARIELEGLYTVLNVVRVGQVHLFYRARMLETDSRPAPRTIEARVFAKPSAMGRARLSHRALRWSATSKTGAGPVRRHSADIG